MVSKIFAILASLLIAGVSMLTGATASAAGTNLVPNPSMEQNSGGQPTGWLKDYWGTNTPSFTYASSGSHSGTYSLTTTMSSYRDGDAKWYFAPISVTPSTNYSISDWYKSTGTTDLDIEITTTGGGLTYFGLDELPGSGNVWKQTDYTFKTPANAAKLTVFHSMVANGQLTTDDYSVINLDNTTPAPTPAPTAPSVSVTSPTNAATVSGTVALTASASDAGSISSVQFEVDGNNVGSADTSAPYSINWDTTKTADGQHTITAVATNNSNLSSTASAVTVNVSNTASQPPVTPPTQGTNLIANPSFETAQDASTPTNWLASNWGTNTSSFSYLTTGHTGSRSADVTTTSYTDGAANWYYNEVPVTAGKTYLYSNWYKSNVDTEVDAEVTMNDGSVQYYWLGNVLTSTNWTQFKATFTVPAGAKSMAIYQILAKKGYLTTDDYYLGEYTPVPYNRALVSVTFDDGWQNQYKNAYPVLQQLGIKSTFYIISGELNDTPDYMSAAQVKNLFATGHEIGSHTVSHPDLTKMTTKQITNQMANSKRRLQNLLGAPVTDFAYPYGAYNATTINIGKRYYASQRSVNDGLNTHDNLDVTQLKIHEVDHNITPAQVQAWIDQAAADHAWLILVYHEVANTPSAADDLQYTTPVSDFTTEMQYLKQSGIATETVHQALAEVQSQQ